MSRTNCPRDGDAFGAILLDIEEVDALTLYRDWAKEMQDAFSAGTDGRCARRRPPDHSARRAAPDVDACGRRVTMNGGRYPPCFLNSDCGNAGCQAFAEAFARDDDIQRTRRAHTRNSPIVRVASPHRSRFAHRPRDDRSRDTAARAPEPQGSASRLSIASSWVHDPCGAQGYPYSRRRLEQPPGHPTAEESRAFGGRVVPFRGSRCPSEVTPTTKLSPPATFS